MSAEQKPTAWMAQHINPNQIISLYDPQTKATLNVTVTTPTGLRDYEANQLIKNIAAWRIPLKDQSVISNNDTTLDRLKMVLAQEGLMISSRFDASKKTLEPAVWYDGGRTPVDNKDTYYSGNSILHAADMMDEIYYADTTFTPTSIKVKKFPNEQDVSVTVYYQDKEIASEVKTLVSEKIPASDGQSSGGGGYYVTFPVNDKVKSEKDLLELMASMGIQFEDMSIDDYFAIENALKKKGSVVKKAEPVKANPAEKPSILNEKHNNRLMNSKKGNPLKK